MSTVILVGGNDRTAPTHYGERLFREVSMRLSHPRVLSCNFAKENPVEREQSEQSWLQWLGQLFPDGAVSIAKEGNWKKQAEESDLIYFHGGKTKTLMAAMRELGATRKIFEDKIVVGSSAGANFLVNGGYSPGADEYVQGIGLADVSVLVHYGSSEKASMRRWSEIRSSVAEKFNQPVLCISEGEFVVVET